MIYVVVWKTKIWKRIQNSISSNLYKQSVSGESAWWCTEEHFFKDDRPSWKYKMIHHMRAPWAPTEECEWTYHEWIWMPASTAWCVMWGCIYITVLLYLNSREMNLGGFLTRLATNIGKGSDWCKLEWYWMFPKIRRTFHITKQSAAHHTPCIVMLNLYPHITNYDMINSNTHTINTV